MNEARGGRAFIILNGNYGCRIIYTIRNGTSGPKNCEQCGAILGFSDKDVAERESRRRRGRKQEVFDSSGESCQSQRISSSMDGLFYFRLKISFNLKNGRVKALSEACLDLTYFKRNGYLLNLLHGSNRNIWRVLDEKENLFISFCFLFVFAICW